MLRRSWRMRILKSWGECIMIAPIRILNKHMRLMRAMLMIQWPDSLSHRCVNYNRTINKLIGFRINHYISRHSRRSILRIMYHMTMWFNELIIYMYTNLHTYHLTSANTSPHLHFYPGVMDHLTSYASNINTTVDPNLNMPTSSPLLILIYPFS